MADVRSLQSQLHRVNGRSVCGDGIILPLSSMSEVLNKDRHTFSEMFWNGTSFQQTFVGVKEELGAQSPRTSVSAIGNSIGARCRIFLHGNELVKLGPINGPTDVVRSLLNIS